MLDPATTANRGDALRVEYAALRHAAGVLPLADFGVLRIERRDRVSWLHKLTTANVQALAEGQGTYALLLNASGHVVADFTLFRAADALILYTWTTAKEKLSADLRRAMFREKVSVGDASDACSVLTLQGPQAQRVLAAALPNLPRLEPSQFAAIDLEGAMLTVASIARVETGGFDLLIPRERAVHVLDVLVAAGATPVTMGALNIVRVEDGIAWYGYDFDETMLAPEARLEQHIAENKGCYTGQEVMARIRNRGHVNRLLVQFEVEGETVPKRGDRVFSDGREVGWITSPVWSFARNAPLALGYLRREVAASDGTLVRIAHEQLELNATVRIR